MKKICLASLTMCLLLSDTCQAQWVFVISKKVICEEGSTFKYSTGFKCDFQLDLNYDQGKEYVKQLYFQFPIDEGYSIQQKHLRYPISTKYWAVIEGNYKMYDCTLKTYGVGTSSKDQNDALKSAVNDMHWNWSKDKHGFTTLKSGKVGSSGS